jgi:hypothetical protein
MAVANRATGQGELAIDRLVHDEPAAIYTLSVRDRERTRALLRANEAEPDVLWLDVESGQVYSADNNDARIPVLVAGMTGEDRSESSRDDAAKQQRCPSCGTRDAIRYLGSSVTTLASVDVPLASRPTAGAALDRALHRLTDGWRHASDEPPAPPASARAAIADPAPVRVDAAVDRGGTRAQSRAVVAYATTADRRGFCFFANPAAR